MPGWFWWWVGFLLLVSAPFWALSASRAQQSGESYISSTSGLTAKSTSYIQQGKTLVTIHQDGTIEYGPNYTPDAAAKAFWDAVGVEQAARNCK